MGHDTIRGRRKLHPGTRTHLGNLLLAGTGEVGGVLDEGGGRGGDVGPEVGGKEAVRLRDGLLRGCAERIE